MALDRRVGLSAVTLLGAAMLADLLYGPGELDYTLRTEFSNVSRPLFEHFFEMDNWHLLGVADETLVNRLPLQMVPAPAFYLALLWRQMPERASGVENALARESAQ